MEEPEGTIMQLSRILWGILVTRKHSASCTGLTKHQVQKTHRGVEIWIGAVLQSVSGGIDRSLSWLGCFALGDWCPLVRTSVAPQIWSIWPMWLANSKRQPCFYPP